jgi:hypothetical protein
VDFDGGASATGIPISAMPDPQCVGKPWKNKESRQSRRGCGLGFELLLLIVPLRLLASRRGSHGVQ